MSTNKSFDIGNSASVPLLQRCLTVVDKIRKHKENGRQSAFIPIPTTNFSMKRHLLYESQSIKKARLQSYSKWPHITPSRGVMSSNGWFYCNINDRVVCIYCNTICQRWKRTDDPREVHERLASTCPFVRSVPLSSKDTPRSTNNCHTHHYQEIFQPYHKSMCEIFRREATFNNSNWEEISPSVNDLVRAGFFYSGIGNTVTCFYCGGSLHQWSMNDDPKIEHSRWFPNCLYAKHLCGDDLYAQIQIAKQHLAIEQSNHIDKETFKRRVNARLDLPIVQRLRTKYRLPIIKRCIEDQLKTDQHDLASDKDLIMACFILQKQIEVCQANLDKIIIPSQNQTSVNSIEVSKRKLEECLICLTEEKQLTCMPCGHLCACVPCGYALQSCPLCREEIQSFVRIYV